MAFPDHGDAFTAASLNNLLTPLSDSANTIASGVVSRGTLDHRHLPSSIRPDLFTNGYSSIQTPAITTVETYQTWQGGSGGSTAQPPDYQRFGTGAPNAPYGAPTLSDEGWRIPALTNNAANAAEVTFAQHTPADENITAYRVSFYIDLRDATGSGISNPHNLCVLMGVGAADSSGNRYVFPDSVRWASARAVKRGPLAMVFFVNSGEITTALSSGLSNFSKFFGVVSSRARIITSNDRADPILAGFGLSVRPLVAEEL